MKTLVRFSLVLAFSGSVFSFGGSRPLVSADPVEEKAISFRKDVEPILRANCAGCHQPARQLGGYLMTDFDRLFQGGESGSAAIVRGKPDESELLAQITPDKDGRALMPKNAPSLSVNEIDTIRGWIAQGAKNDSVLRTSALYSDEHPPTYEKPPVVTSMDVSADGGLLAIAGFHEVLLHNTKRLGEPVGRLVGFSERIERVRFNHDGTKLAVCGGLPGRTGELQIWDVAKGVLVMSKTIGHDTICGVNWSPDGKVVTVGCPDNTLRGFDVGSGKQVLFMGSHNDWPLDTVFASDGTHVISVGRDMTAKLTEVETERFVDNITSITPGALKGGILSVARHPSRDEIVIGGSDGVPKVYRVYRGTKRVIGDDSNLIRELPALDGRVFSVDVSPDGSLIAAGASSTDDGQIAVYAYDFDTTLTDDLKEAMEKVAAQRSEEQKKLIAAYHHAGVKELFRVGIAGVPIYAVTFDQTNGKLLATGGDGMIRVYDSRSGEVQGEFSAVPLEKPGSFSTVESSTAVQRFPTDVPDSASSSSSPEFDLNEIKSVEVSPEELVLSGEFDYAQMLVTAVLKDGSQAEAIRLASYVPSSKLISVSGTGLVLPLADGVGSLTIRVGEASVKVPVRVAGLGQPLVPDYIRDVNPALTRLGCNLGTCHGAKDGKNGFKLSLRGYDALYDVRAFRDDHASRRVNRASAADSLMLLKATGTVPHVGGQLTREGEGAYEIIRRWIENGSQLDLKSTRVARIELEPQMPVVPLAGHSRQFRVVAFYLDGSSRDVTRDAFIESGDTEIAIAEGNGVLRAVRRGESPVLARFEGAYAATTMTVMGDRGGFTWAEPESWTEIDQLVARKWKRMKIRPSEVCSDADFIRRVMLDLTGLPPTAEEVHLFMADRRPVRMKREELIDRLIGSEFFIDHWTNKWADLLQVNSKFLGDEGATAFHAWIRQQVARNRPYDQFVSDILTASGSNKDNPPASYYKILRDPLNTMENTTHLFLAIRFNCNKCHDHPFERWTQDQYYETAAYFGRVDFKADPASKDRKIGGSAVEGATPLYEIVYEKDTGEVKHDRTGAETAPKFPFPATFETANNASRRQQLAAWMTSADNQYFARSYVNRLWGYLLGVGLVEPLDDVRAGNPATNADLLEYLTEQFIDHGFDTRHVIRLICASRTYQLSVKANEWNADDNVNYSHAIARRLPAEVLYDAIHRVLGSKPDLTGMSQRAATLTDAKQDAKSGFLASFGRPARESACECERSMGMELGNVMTLISGSTLADAIASPSNELTELVNKERDDRTLFRQLFLKILNRPASEAEVDAAIGTIQHLDDDHAALQEALVDRELQRAPLLAKEQLARAAAIEIARQELDAYVESTREELTRQQEQRQQRIDTASMALQAFEDDFDTHLRRFENSFHSQADTWTTLNPDTIKPDTELKIERLEDGSFLTSGTPDRVKLRLIADVPLSKVSTIRIEALPHPSLPRGGPGAGVDGTFVLTELNAFNVKPNPEPAPTELDATLAKDGKKPKFQKLEFGKPVANDAATDYPVSEATDTKLDRNGNGWSVDRNFGRVQWAVFPLKTPLNAEEGETKVRLALDLVHDDLTDNTFFGRFRIDVTDQEESKLGLPRVISELVALPPQQRTASQWADLADALRLTDEAYLKLNRQLAEARKPLPVDPKLEQHKLKLERASNPIPEDPMLARLRADYETSKKQLENKRLIAAQDLAWALINSHAFLFNH